MAECHLEAFSTGRYIIQSQNTNINGGFSMPSVVLAAAAVHSNRQLDYRDCVLTMIVFLLLRQSVCTL